MKARGRVDWFLLFALFLNRLICPGPPAGRPERDNRQTTSERTMINIQCPCCGKGIKLPNSAVGQHGLCLNCNSEYFIPEPEAGGAPQAELTMAVSPDQPNGNPFDASYNRDEAPPRKWSPLLALLLACLFPGLGQLYKGQYLRAVIWMIVIFIGYVAFFKFYFPVIGLLILCWLDAGISQPKPKPQH